MEGITIGMVIASLVVYIINVIASWRIFTKAGEAGWKAIIPIYSQYVMYKFTWETKFFWLVLVIAIVGSIFNGLSESFGIIVFAVIYCVLMIAVTILQIMQLHRLSKAFGHGAGFTLGLIFLSPIFALILAFGKSQYLGKNNN